ncbi:MAG: tRNA (guanosine(46)-N7)-methyltransferase TrmB [Clostridia bacterium]|nr:tRNA (guanosine(46)-N7)-methyltransferase TrmB [Clostridia bacterium]
MRMHRKDNLDSRLLACKEVLTLADLSQKNMKLAAEIKEYLDLKAIFGNDNPVHLEVGCGKGAFVSGMAKLHPDINFIAIEKVSNVIVTACENAIASGIKNVHFINCAAEVLPKYFKENTFSRVYLNFSDPLPKKGYLSQRLTHPRMLKVYASLCKEGAQLWQKTDNKPLFDFSLDSFKEVGWQIKEVCLDLAANPFEGNVITEHEQKFMDEGKPIYRAVAEVKKVN